MSYKSATHDMAMTLHKLYCDRGGEGHECVGRCTITANGVKLECALCGKGDDLPMEGRILDKLRRVFQAAGINFDSLSYDAQRAAWDASQAEETRP